MRIFAVKIVFMKNLCKILVLLTLTSCTTTKYIEVPVERVVRDVQRVTDSIIVNRDSIVKVYVNGDTVISKIIVNNDIYHKSEVHDTITDSVEVVKPVEVEKPVYIDRPQWWPVWISLAVLALFLIYKYRVGISQLLTRLRKTLKHFIS